LPFPRRLGIPSTTEVLCAIGRLDESHLSCKANPQGLPLHIKEVPPIELAEINKLCEELGHNTLETWLRLRRILEDPTFYAPAAETEPTHLTYDHSLEQHQQMVQAQLAELHDEAEFGTALGWVRKKGALELKKGRWRLIDHTVTANKIPRNYDLHLNTQPGLHAAVHEGEAGIPFDFSSYFHQFPYGKDVRRYLVFRAPDGQLYHLTRLAMGQSHACDIAHFVSTVLMRVALKREALDSGGPELKWRCHIDNGLFIGPIARLKRAFQHFITICAYARVTINADKHDPCTVCEFVGLQLDFTAKTVDFTDKIKQKAALLEDFLRTNPSMNNLAVASIVGLGLFSIKSTGNSVYPAQLLSGARYRHTGLFRGNVPRRRTGYKSPEPHSKRRPTCARGCTRWPTPPHIRSPTQLNLWISH